MRYLVRSVARTRARKFGDVKRLRDVIDRAELQATDLLIGVGGRGEENDRDVPRQRIVGQAFADLKSVGGRHLDVQQDQIRLHGRRELQARLAVVGRVDLERLAAQPYLQQVVD